MKVSIIHFHKYRIDRLIEAFDSTYINFGCRYEPEREFFSNLNHAFGKKDTFCHWE